MNRAPDTRFSDMIMSMRRSDRRVLNEAVKRLLNEADPAAKPTFDQVFNGPVGTVIKNAKGDTVFKKTDEGWKALVRIQLGDVLKLVKPEVKDAVQAGLQELKENESYSITKAALVDPSIANEPNGLRFTMVISKRSGKKVFADMNPIDETKLKELVDQLKLVLPKDVGQQSGDGAAPDTFTLGNIRFNYNYSDSKLKITVNVKDGFDDFDTLFGSQSKVAAALVKEIGGKKLKGPVPITIPYDKDKGGNSIIEKIATPFWRPNNLKFLYDQEKMIATYEADVKPEAWEEMARQLGTVAAPGSAAAAGGGLSKADLVKLEGDTKLKGVLKNATGQLKELDLLKYAADRLQVTNLKLNKTNLDNMTTIAGRNAGSEILNAVSIRVGNVFKAQVIDNTNLPAAGSGSASVSGNTYIVKKIGEDEYNMVLTYDQALEIFSKVTQI